MAERMTVGALIEELQRVAAAHPYGDLYPVLVGAPDGPLRFRPWLELSKEAVHPFETGEHIGLMGPDTYEALVIRATFY